MGTWETRPRRCGAGRGSGCAGRARPARWSRPCQGREGRCAGGVSLWDARGERQASLRTRSCGRGRGASSEVTVGEGKERRGPLRRFRGDELAGHACPARVGNPANCAPMPALKGASASLFSRNWSLSDQEEAPRLKSEKDASRLSGTGTGCVMAVRLPDGTPVPSRTAVSFARARARAAQVASRRGRPPFSVLQSRLRLPVCCLPAGLSLLGRRDGLRDVRTVVAARPTLASPPRLLPRPGPASHRRLASRASAGHCLRSEHRGCLEVSCRAL